MSALSSTAALPLIATPSIASEVGHTCSRPDLSERFERVYARWRQRREQDLIESRAFDEAERDGRAFAFADPDGDGWTVLNEEINATLDAIRTMEAVSLGDIRLKARACALENLGDWLNEDAAELDPGPNACRDLVDSVLHLLGSEALPGVAKIRLTA